MSNKLILLGTGTCQIQQHRMATSALLSLDGSNIVFDMGRGVTQRLLQAGLKNDDVEHIVFSHFHPDHISDLIPFLQAASWSRIDPRSKPLHIYGPRGVKVQVYRLLSLFGPDDLTKQSFEISIHEIREPSLKIGDRSFEFVHLPPAGNHGLRFIENGTRVALTGDSYFHEEEIEFLKGVDIAVIDSGHLTEEEIISLAVSAQPKLVVCSHLYQELNAELLTQKAKEQGFKGAFKIAQDLDSFDL